NSEFHQSPEFDGYISARASGDLSWGNRIEMCDLLTSWLMQSQIERRPGTIEAIMERRTDIEAALANVPEDISLEEEIPEQTWQRLEKLFETFRVKGAGLASMTKGLCMKRS